MKGSLPHCLREEKNKNFEPQPAPIQNRWVGINKDGTKEI
jgi:hypothetical protein